MAIKDPKVYIFILMNTCEVIAMSFSNFFPTSVLCEALVLQYLIDLFQADCYAWLLYHNHPLNGCVGAIIHFQNDFPDSLPINSPPWILPAIVGLVNAWHGGQCLRSEQVSHTKLTPYHEQTKRVNVSSIWLYGGE